MNYLYFLVIAAVAATARPISLLNDDVGEILVKRCSNCCDDYSISDCCYDLFCPGSKGAGTSGSSVINWASEGSRKSVMTPTVANTITIAPPTSQSINYGQVVGKGATLPNLPSERAPMRLPSNVAPKMEAHMPAL